MMHRPVSAPEPATETARLAALDSYNILDSFPEAEYDAITQLVTQICGMPVSTITFVDDQRQWFKSAVGLIGRQDPREHSFCARAIQTPDQFTEIPDARLDPRFAQNPLTTGEPHVIFYAGLPLIDEDGFALGTLCVIDHQPNRLTETQKQTLSILTRQVVMLLTLRRKNAQLHTYSENMEQIVAERTADVTHLNQHLQLATEAAQLGVWAYDEARDELVCDAKICAIMGYPPPTLTLTQAAYQQLLHPEDRLLFNDTHHIPQDAGLSTVERRIIRPDGTLRWIEVCTYRKPNATGKLMGTVGTIRDITERKATEHALRQSEQRYRSLVENINEVVFQTNRQRELVYLSPYWTTLIGYSVEESLGKPSSYFYASAEDQAITKQIFSDCMDGHKTVDRFEASLLHQDGSIRWVEMFIRIQHDDTGLPNGLAGIIIDVTPRKQTELALRQSEQRFRDIAENVSEIFWIHSAKPFGLLYINSAYERLTGESAEALYTNRLPFLDITLPEDQPALRLNLERYAVGEELDIECRTRLADQSIRWFNIRTFVKRDAQGKPVSYIGLATDITDRKNREINLQQALEKEKVLNQLKSQFVATASHEFRTPLATIQSSIDLVKLYNDMPGEKARPTIQRHLSVIEKEIMHFSNMLSDVLNYGRIEAGKAPFKPEPTDLPALIHTVIQTHFSQRTDKRMVTVATTGIPYPLPADPNLLGQVLINLLTNAFKFSPTDPMLSVVFGPDQVQLLIIDQGIGIPADEQANLFSTFFRARNAGTIQGTGLGLVIAREFVHQHGGDITVESEENVGTTFTITLPFSRKG